MGDNSQHHHQKPPAATVTRLGIRPSAAAAAGCGEIVEVQGGHIVRSTGRKDRHSKVCTAKGPRDRRVRLSAHTAIQFYDVQDRLGYDRPSKAVDWLINKAKAAIDELAQLPPWDPAETLSHAAAKPKRNRNHSQQHQEQQQEPHHQFNFDVSRGSSEMVQQNPNVGEGPNNDNGSGFLPPSLGSDSIADTIKPFLPTGGACASTEAPPPTILQCYHHHQPDLLPRTSSHCQDLRLSLQSFHDPPPMILHHHHHDADHQTEPVLFGAPNNPLGFDAAASSSGWEQPPHHHHHQRLVGWSGSGGGTYDTGGGSGVGGGFVFASPTTPYQPMFGQSQLFSSQRGTLQSSNTLSFRAWVDHHQRPPVIVPTTDDLHHHHPYHIPSPTVYQSAIPGIGFSGEFSGFRIPARIQGDVVEEEQDGGIPNKPFSASSVSRH